MDDKDIPMHMLKTQPERTMLIVLRTIKRERIKELQKEVRKINKELDDM